MCIASKIPGVVKNTPLNLLTNKSWEQSHDFCCCGIYVECSKLVHHFFVLMVCFWHGNSKNSPNSHLKKYITPKQTLINQSIHPIQMCTFKIIHSPQIIIQDKTFQSHLILYIVYCYCNICLVCTVLHHNLFL